MLSHGTVADGRTKQLMLDNRQRQTSGDWGKWTEEWENVMPRHKWLLVFRLMCSVKYQIPDSIDNS